MRFVAAAFLLYRDIIRELAEGKPSHRMHILSRIFGSFAADRQSATPGFP